MTNTKRALITGVTGQDGAYLSELLLSKNYEVFGTSRDLNSKNYWRLNELGVKKDIKIFNQKSLNSRNSLKFISDLMPTEIYNLSGFSSVSKSFNNPILAFKSNTIECLQILNAIKLSNNKNIKFYQASSSEMYGNTIKTINEKTKFNPLSPYAVSKLSAHHITINYRNNYDIFAANGILFNHESPLRGDHFISKKIIKNLIKYKKNNKLFEVGNISARRDWGHSRDFVKAMYLILQEKEPDDFIITSEINYSIKDLINMTCTKLNIKSKWKGSGINQTLVDISTNKIIIKINKKYFRPLDIDISSGSSLKAKSQFKWQCKISFDSLIKEMIDFELKKLS